MNKVNIEKINTTEKELIVRTGEALPLKEPKVIGIIGNIDSVARFLANRIHKVLPDTCHIFPDRCHILVDRDSKKLTLVMDETDPYGGMVTGRLEETKDIQKWQINSGVSYEHKQLADFIKMNRMYFEDRATAMKLASELSNIKIKTNKEIEKADNNRGEMRYAIGQQVIQSNIPEKFNLKMPIFKGRKPVSFEVEVYVDASSFEVQLVSPDLAELIEEATNEAIDEQLAAIEEVTSGDIVVIEV